MKYILVGKQSATLNGIKSKLSKSNDITVFNSAAEMNKENITDSKIIYIITPIPYNWEWWMSADISNEFNRKKFVEETIDFRDVDPDSCDKVIKYDGTGLSDLIEEINKYITEVENGSNTILN